MMTRQPQLATSRPTHIRRQARRLNHNPLPGLDELSPWPDRLLPYCQLRAGEIWHDPAVLDLFADSGTTLLAVEILDRVCLTADPDPVYCEVTARRLENFRSTAKLGRQHGSAFENELPGGEATADTSTPRLDDGDRLQRTPSKGHVEVGG